MARWDVFLRGAVLTVADNRAVRSLFETYGMRLGVKRFVAAEQLEEALDAVCRLNEKGLLATLDYLGESVQEKQFAEEAADQAIRVLRRIQERELRANISIKLTQLGLLIDPAFCETQLVRILAEAERTDRFVRIDMEHSQVTEATIELFEKLLERYGSKRVGLVLQSYLYRSEADRERLGALGANLRIVKGAYNEPKTVAYPNKKDVDESYMRLVKAHLQQGLYTAVATHDEQLIGRVIHYIRERGIAGDRFEFQMLYGIATALQLKLAKEGYQVRVYAPFGEAWYPYFTRRLAERPANVWFVVKGLFRA